MLFTFFGSESVFFGDAFFGINGAHVNELSASSTQIVVQQPDTGVITTVTGTGFTFGSSGDVTGGTITGFSFALNGSAQATVTGISWNVVAFSNALDEIDEHDNYAPMAALLSLSSSLTFDGSTATGPMNLSDLADLAPFVTTGMTVTGTDFDDTLVGGAGNDTITPGGNTGYDFLLGTTGNDQYDFRGASGDDYYEISYSGVSGPITVNLDAPGDTGSIVGAGWTDTLLGVADAATSSYGGIGVAGTTGNDTFNINTGSGWMAVGGGDGSDTYNLTLDGGARVYFNWAGYNMPGPTQGLNVDLVTGVVSNDGFGNTDQINFLGGTGRLEIRATYNDDMILGSARNESFILERGNDTLDGGDGFDRLRYDRSGVDSVTVDLGTGMVWGTWYGHSFTHDVTGIEWVRGSRSGDDLMFGDGNANRLDGRGGNDTLNGGGGRDTLIGGDGDDLLNIGNYAGGDGGLGNDTLDFSTVTTGWAWVDFDSYTAGVTVTVDGVANTGTATSGSNTDTLVNVANPMSGDGLTVAAARGGGDDTFNINTAAGQWIALRGNDGVDTYNLTGQGAVRLEFRSSNGATVDLSTGTVSDDGYGNAETINGTVWELRGDTGNDNFTGSAASESFILAGGNDTLDGGLGFDRLHMDRSDMGAVIVDLSAGTATGTYDGAAFSHSVTGIEWVRGSDQSDLITGNADDNLLRGQDGNDTLNGLGGNDTLEGGTGISVLDGGDGNDTLSSGTLNDTLFGGTGDDLLDSGDGNDNSWGGAGNDTFFAGAGEDLLSGADGNDLMWGGAGDDTFYGGVGDDTLGGGDGNDLIWTGTGDNAVYAGAGNDTLGGSSGRDELWGGEGNNVFYGGAGADTLGAGSGADEIWAGDGWDIAYGAGGNDTVAGGDGNDELWAGTGNDLVFGDAGDDTLSGADDNDTVWGGAGNDLIYGASGEDQLSGGDDNDTIWAGSENDTLWGDGGDDQLYGVGGDDLLVGHGGNDTLTGGTGADSFVFRTGYGADVVADFDGATGDTLLLDDALWASHGTLTAAQVVSQFGSLNGSGDVLLTFDGGETLTLTGITTLTGLEADISII